MNFSGNFTLKIMSKICGIYKITSPTGKIYIGQSVDIEDRWRYHKRLLPYYHINILYRSLMKHGVDSHTFEIIQECEKSELNKLERYYIEKYDTFQSNHGMNLTKGGDSNVVFSKSTLSKMSNAKKGKRPTHLIGYTHSEETKEILRQKSIGNTNWLGRHHSEETKEKLRQANLGKETSKETIEKLIGRKNNVHSTSIYYGVSMKKNKKSTSWQAVIRINKKQKYIGTFKTEIEAAKAYDSFVKENIPYKVPLNFE